MNAVDSEGETPLHEAAERGHVEVVEVKGIQQHQLAELRRPFCRFYWTEGHPRPWKITRVTKPKTSSVLASQPAVQIPLD